MDGKRLIILAATAALTISSAAQAQQSYDAWMPYGTPPTSQTFVDLQSASYVDSVMPASFVSNCGCADACNDCCAGCCSDCCCTPPWAHRTGVYGEILYLRPRNAEVSYAVPFNGAVVPGVPPVQVGPVAVASPDYDTGFRFGVTKAFDDCSSVSLTYSLFQSNVNHATTQAPLRAMVLHPGTANAAQNFLSAAGSAGVDFDLIDADYRAVWNSCDYWAVNYLVGVRYARMDQDFVGVFTPTGDVETLVTNVNFEGLGLRLGLDGERHSCNGFLVYGKAIASFVAGEFGGSYVQGTLAQPGVVNTTWNGTRIVPILDLEVGGGWQSACGRYRLTAGYLISAWFNTINSDTWIEGVQTNNFVNLSDGLTFDGLTARAEVRF